MLAKRAIVPLIVTQGAGSSSDVGSDGKLVVVRRRSSGTPTAKRRVHPTDTVLPVVPSVSTAKGSPGRGGGTALIATPSTAAAATALSTDTDVALLMSGGAVGGDCSGFVWLRMHATRTTPVLHQLYHRCTPSYVVVTDVDDDGSGGAASTSSEPDCSDDTQPRLCWMSVQIDTARLYLSESGPGISSNSSSSGGGKSGTAAAAVCVPLATARRVNLPRFADDVEHVVSDEWGSVSGDVAPFSFSIDFDDSKSGGDAAGEAWSCRLQGGHRHAHAPTQSLSTQSHSGSSGVECHLPWVCAVSTDC